MNRPKLKEIEFDLKCVVENYEDYIDELEDKYENVKEEVEKLEEKLGNLE